MPVGTARVADTVEPRPRGRRPRRGRYGAVPSKTTGAIVLIVIGALFAVPIAALAWFSFTTASTGAFTLSHYAALVDPAQASNYSELFAGIGNSLILAVIVVAIILVLLLPAMLLAELRFPKVHRVLEFVCLLPITVPTIVLVVGFVPVYQVVQSVLGSDPWTLSFAIGVIVLPYAYRPIQANIGVMNLTILTEAARSLGASWPVAVWRVVLPNLRRGLLSACLLTISVVLGEFTIANFLGQNTFQTALLLLQQTDPYVSAFLAVVSLLFVFVLLVVISTAGSIGRPRKKKS
ncbi:ABC transporter permease [Amnibacterium kyonggiense]|uniref:ABC transporter permease n=1 Tax=Amnibacterium kyonggiense TaxID=595671 RepID=UPI001FEBC25F|nr:ABC transporter permease subunit [Amnibacterium kyonggiense]